MKNPPSILTIAGSDSGGGAGIQADLKTISMLGGFGMSVITALTAQNSQGVTGIHAPEPEFVALQLKTVLDDFPVAGAKTGMLFSSEIIEAVADVLEGKDFPLVVDPVCVSQSGHRLLQEDAVESLKNRMIPLADLLTPNRPEAELLAGMTIDTPEDAKKAIERLLEMGAKAVLLKGGHFEQGELGDGQMADWLAVPGEEPLVMTQRMVHTNHTHGTGCTLSAATAAGLGHGLSLHEAVENAQNFLNLGLRSGFGPGKGYGPPNHIAPLLRAQAERGVLAGLEDAAKVISEASGVARLIPQVRMNIAQALPWSVESCDVAAFEGRISATSNDRVIVPSGPSFGASKHLARVVLAATEVHPGFTAAAACCANAEVLDAMEALGLNVVEFDRESIVEEGVVECGTLHALKTAADAAKVDVVVDSGAKGLEPIARVLGKDALEVARKLVRVAGILNQG